MFCIVLGSWVLLGYLTGDFVYTAPNEQKQSQSENIGFKKHTLHGLTNGIMTN